MHPYYHHGISFEWFGGTMHVRIGRTGDGSRSPYPDHVWFGQIHKDSTVDESSMILYQVMVEGKKERIRLPLLLVANLSFSTSFFLSCLYLQNTPNNNRTNNNNNTTKSTIKSWVSNHPGSVKVIGTITVNFVSRLIRAKRIPSKRSTFIRKVS